ncbi:MAG TPA: hypothetical protein PLR20_11140 [Syntrophales bacterium]|jgi:hypothetical protein|nr:hypothetical protein [Syntrophales bacterium]HOX94147.1 hypothetical protein [Syntrophales bacterium]HPN25413.1 hypothetical protein [Syntrophales bacterium]HQM29895.1 hypothetical protein [Syntrophales bacterium]
MKWLRKYSLFLLAIGLTLPLSMAILNCDFYEDNDLVRISQISMADGENLLSFLKKNPGIFAAADETFPSVCTGLCEIQPFIYIHPSSNQAIPVLRC